jgi:hypothetical protein
VRPYLQQVALVAGIALTACSVSRVTFTGEGNAAAEDCAASGDEDGNGLADCTDPACRDTAACQIDGGMRPGRIQITTTGIGLGTITASVAGARCDAACLAAVPAGTMIDFQATAAAGSWFRGWLAGCTGRHACTVAAADGLTITGDFTPEPNRVFLSSTVHDGNFGGLSGGDAVCQSLATAAGLSGTYRILLSSTTIDWTSRLGGARGWIRTDGEPAGEFVPGGRGPGPVGIGLYNLRLDERGRDVGIRGIWSVQVSAATGINYCSAWTSNANSGHPNVGGWGYTTQAALLDAFPAQAANVCGAQNHFLCAQVDRNVPVAPIPTLGRLAFTTRAKWDTGTGVAAADALCATEASAAGKAGTFKALLATPTASAISRFNTSGAPWVRADGIPLLATAKAFESASYFDVAPGEHADGTVSVEFTTIALGADATYKMGTLANTCSGWASTGPQVIGPTPWDTFPGQWASGCGAHPVICFQE